MGVFIGHPASREDLEKDLNDLANGTPITGPGCSAAGDEAGGEGGAAKKCDGADANTAIESFNTDAKKIMEDQKEAVSGMPRAFLVLVVEGKYDVKEAKVSYKLTHYQVFVGAQDKT